MIAKKKVTTVTLVALVHKEGEGTMKRAERLDAFHENQPHVWRRLASIALVGFVEAAFVVVPISGILNHVVACDTWRCSIRWSCGSDERLSADLIHIDFNPLFGFLARKHKLVPATR